MNTVILPFFLPLLTATLLLLLPPGKPRRWLAAFSAFAQLVVAIAFVVACSGGERWVLGVGAWMPPLGIALVIDLLAAIMLFLSSAMAFGCILFGYAELPSKLDHPLRLPLWQFLVAGINLSFITGDLFNLFVAFEIMLISSYALLTLEANDRDIKHAYPYLAINLVGSALFLLTTGVVYSIFGTLNYAEISQRAAAMPGDSNVTLVALLLFFVFAIKAGVFPFYYWLPNSYPTLATPLGAFFAGMLTKVGVYVLLRMFGTVLPHDLHGVHNLMAWLAGATMIFGVLGAISRPFIRGILSWHILSQIGYMVLAIGLFTPFAIAACILYIIHHIIVKGTLFLIGGAASYRLKSGDDLKNMGGLFRAEPLLAACFLLQAFSLGGVPPLSGFWGKYIIFVEGMKAGEYVLVGAAVLAGIMTLFSMLKIWNGAFWPALPVNAPVQRQPNYRLMLAIIGVYTALSIAIALGSGEVLKLSITAAETALDQAGYIEAVLGLQGKGAGY